MEKLKKDKHYKETVINNLADWANVSDIHKNITGEATIRKEWIFRGHRNADWRLKTTLERAMESFEIPLKKLLL